MTPFSPIWRALGVLAARQTISTAKRLRFRISILDVDSEPDVNGSSLFSTLYFHVNVMEIESRITKR